MQAGGVGGLQGTPSSLSGALSVTAVGGGAGAGPGGAGSGGSGGGGNFPGGSGQGIDVTGQGNPGGDGVPSGGPAYGSGGGGGAGMLDKTEHHLRVVMEVLVFNFHQHSKIQDHQLDSLDQDQQLSSLLVVEEEFLMMQNQPPDKVVDLADLMLEQDLVHIILIQELQDFLLKQIVDLEEVVVDHQQHQVVQVVLVSSSSHIPLHKYLKT